MISWFHGFGEMWCCDVVIWWLTVWVTYCILLNSVIEQTVYDSNYVMFLPITLSHSLLLFLWIQINPLFHVPLTHIPSLSLSVFHSLTSTLTLSLSLSQSHLHTLFPYHTHRHMHTDINPHIYILASTNTRYVQKWTVWSLRTTSWKRSCCS